jgi:radical SAM protein with 4Fe4S-binding SPASM domain
MRLPFPRREKTHPRSIAGPELLSYQHQFPGGEAHLHLRTDQNGRGLLLINANRAVHLNPTAAFMARLFLDQKTPRAAAGLIQKRFNIGRATAESDFQHIADQISELIQPNGACPVHELDLDTLQPFSQMPDAPYRMDLALTYRCNCNCAHCYNARPRSFPELATAQWIEILDRLWDIGVPHICFTGGEATLREDLPILISHAQSLGQITGLLSNGRKLADRTYVDELVSAGLDHIQCTLESHNAGIHDGMVRAKGAWGQTVQGIENAIAAGLYVMTNTTLLQENAASLNETLDFLAGIKVPTVGLNALIHAGSGTTVGTGLPESSLGPLLEVAREKTDQYGQRLIWYTPTQYCHFDPVQMELGVKGCTAARYNMCVEPDGSVIPCQSYYESVGNLLHTEWTEIWNHEVCLQLRDRSYVPQSCEGCAILAECGGGCPLSLGELHPQGAETIPLTILTD